MYRWYHTWWGVTLISFGVCLIIGLGFFISLTVKYWWQLRRGETPGFVQEYAAHFTRTNNQVGGTVNRADLETVDSPMLGTYGAPITIVEFYDFKCPNCRLAAPIMHQIDALYHKKVRIIMRHFPAESIPGHAGATQLAQLGYCAQRQNAFWPLYDILYNEQDTLPNPLSSATIATLADRIGVRADELVQCMAAKSTEAAVTKDYLAGVTAGVRGTPTFFVNGRKIEGVIPLEAWKKFLDQQ